MAEAREPRRGRRGGGREARRALRSAPLADEIRPVRAGMSGGRFRPLSDDDVARIHHAALQLLSEHVSGNDSSYYSYELNLVLEDGRRLSVVDHGDCEQLREDAQLLSQLLGKPVWDAAD